MKTAKKLTGIMLATTAAGLFALAPLSSAVAGEDAGVHCMGANACKGKSDCKTANNACKGKNACKGEGFVVTKSADECSSMGGKVEDSE